jgi:hypothetical protein
MVRNKNQIRKTIFSPSAAYRRRRKINQIIQNSEIIVEIADPDARPDGDNDSQQERIVQNDDVEIANPDAHPDDDSQQKSIVENDDPPSVNQELEQTIEIMEPEIGDELCTVDDEQSNLHYRLAKWACSPTLCATDINRLLRIMNGYFSFFRWTPGP